MEIVPARPVRAACWVGALGCGLSLDAAYAAASFDAACGRVDDEEKSDQQVNIWATSDCL